MNWSDHSDLRGKHSLFSPSQPSFFNYTPEEFYTRLLGKYRSQLGEDIHSYAFYAIKRFHKVTNTRELIKDIDQWIFSKYFDEKHDLLPKEAQRELKCLNYVAKSSPEVFETIRCYINDAIGFGMKTEVVLYYTYDFRGTADALIFSNNILRIHDLKTGMTQPHIEQLFGYAALFCLENHIHPEKISFELRIYQGNDILIAAPTPDDINFYVNKYREFNQAIENEEGGAQ